mmetsp:Transcript_5174/g.10007  ORF Transcript_5174/g.10007 Transcript_5174/m.10007 type:complete len:441 (+) Transcript_5174:65-1387(+)
MRARTGAGAHLHERNTSVPRGVWRRSQGHMRPSSLSHVADNYCEMVQGLVAGRSIQANCFTVSGQVGERCTSPCMKWLCLNPTKLTFTGLLPCGNLVKAFTRILEQLWLLCMTARSCLCALFTRWDGKSRRADRREGYKQGTFQAGLGRRRRHVTVAFFLLTGVWFLPAPVAGHIDGVSITGCSSAEHSAAWSKCLAETPSLPANSPCSRWSANLTCCSASRMSEVAAARCTACSACMVLYRCDPSARFPASMECPRLPPSPPPPPPYYPYDSCTSWDYCGHLDEGWGGWVFFTYVIFMIVGFSSRQSWLPILRSIYERQYRQAEQLLRGCFTRRSRSRTRHVQCTAPMQTTSEAAPVNPQCCARHTGAQPGVEHTSAVALAHATSARHSNATPIAAVIAMERQSADNDGSEECPGTVRLSRTDAEAGMLETHTANQLRV